MRTLRATVHRDWVEPLQTKVLFEAMCWVSADTSPYREAMCALRPDVHGKRKGASTTTFLLYAVCGLIMGAAEARRRFSRRAMEAGMDKEEPG
jgi:hypothetical protein